MILCAGEALIDMLPRETPDGTTAFAPHVGGAVLNTAVALARLGAPCGFFSGLSTDLFGARIVQRLEEDKVDISLAARSDRPTTLAFVTLTDGQARYAFYDENTAGRMLSEGDLPRHVDASACFFGGISLAVEPCADAYAVLSERLAPDMPMMIDPNIRPDFIRDADRYRARIEAMIERADIVKVSDEDLEWLVPGNTLEARAQALLRRGPALVCLTQGAEGAVAFTAERQVSVPATRAEVVDTVGAGDTFNAGILASLSEQGVLTKTALRDLPEEAMAAALTLGVRAAAVTVGRAGANPPRRTELA
ncbi:fructokinase [Palleronia marisminoris]|uniref:2-dehydro-3-deoxygluconokinase n=1 Tax=Palleronia marisminoris TaxID=315423 RepID=A0A1Y5RS64_9RHOB|nr:carbohydrate kinase [Palleronia marisminoris]SFG53006.1 fructokinase [Palleronia marisminoris]SLN23803.1 2-dehydro-3-deoxygluconokinase [Palleronia marisminoris]